MTAAALGVDISRWQPTDLPWRAWVAGGLQVALVQVTHGPNLEPHAGEHLANAHEAHVPTIGAYHYLMPSGAAFQAAAFTAALPPYVSFAALDVEEPGLADYDVLEFCTAYARTCALPLVLYGNYSGLEPILNAHPNLKLYPVWWAEYRDNLPATQPPYAAPHPPAGLNVVAWQWTGHGRLPPYAGDIDLSTWYSLPGAPMPTTNRGCLIGGHAQSTSSIVPIFKKLRPPIVLADENPGLCVDLQADVPTRIARFHHPETGDDHDFEAGGSGRGGWPADKRLRFARASINLPFAHMNPTEGAAATHVQCMGNEWDAQDVG